MIIERDTAFRVVCELMTPKDATQYDVGTGIFVESPAGDGRIHGWIITATHVARKTNCNTTIALANEEGKATVIPITTFGDVSNWKHHPVADISALQIYFNSSNEQYIKNRFFPYDHFNLDKKVVSRDHVLTSIGFPHGLGTDGLFSPFTFRSYAASGFVTLQRADTKTLSTFFCLENPSVGGYSGCPVFDLGYETNGIMTITKERTWCHGFMHGTMSDNTGGKIAMVTPAFYLKDIIP